VTPEESDVLVIGAGAAGLACAQRLQEAGLRFRVLEAASRLGGRADTDYTLAPGRAVEMGAMMVHGKRSSTRSWSDELGVRERRLPVVQRARFSVGRRPIPYRQLWPPFRRPFGFRVFYEGTREIPKALSEYRGPDVSLREFLRARGAGPGVRALVDDLHAHVYAADPDRIGVRGPAEEEAAASERFGYANFQLVEGYDELFRRRAAPFRESIRLEARVRRIRWGGPDVRVETDGPDGGPVVEWRARCAVVTLPVAVLRSDAVVFDPALPAEKRRAMQRIDVGDAAKVGLRLRGSELRSRLGDFSMIWGDGASTFHRPFVGQPEDADALTLTAFTTGREARRRAEMNDRDAVDSTLDELRSVLPESIAIGDVVERRARRWPTDPWALGGYSYLPPGASLSDRRELSRPVDGSLFFAGEATNSEGESGTVHGAIDTGYRAASEALAAVRSGRS
jgi:monoamine oxidase